MDVEPEDVFVRSVHRSPSKESVSKKLKSILKRTSISGMSRMSSNVSSFYVE